MAKLDIQPVSGYWEDDSLDIQPLDIQPIEEEVSIGKRLKSGVKKAWEGVKSTADVGISMPAAGLAGIFGDIAGQEDIFKQLNQRIAGREKAAEGPDPGFLGRLAGVGATLPAQIAAMPFSGIETAKQFVDQGESLPRAYAAGGLDTAGNMLGMALPGVIPGSRLIRAGSGAAINAAQDTATRLGIQGIAQQDKTKGMFAPSWETAALSGIPGAALGAMTKGKAKTKTPTPKPDADSVVGAFKAASDKATGRVDLEVGGETSPVMRVGKDGEAYPATFENEVARKAAEQRMVDLLEQQREAEMPQRMQNAVQEELPFYSSVEEIAAKQASPEQADMFLGNKLPETPETVARQQQMDIQNQKEQLFQSRPQTDEMIAQRQAQEQAKAQQEQQLLDLQQTLTEDAYKPIGDGQGPKTRAARMNKFGQGGGIDPDLLTFGIPKLINGIKTKFTGHRVSEPDSLLNPRTPENISAKQAKAAKSRAIGLTNSIYNSINTLEEVKAIPGKDIGFEILGKMRTPGQQFGSGVEAALRRNTSNKLLQMVSTVRTRAEANTNALLRKYITGPEGVNKPFMQMSPQDRLDTHQLAIALDKGRLDYTPEIGKAYGLSKEADAFMQAYVRMTNGEYEVGKKTNAELGIEHFERLPGYSRVTFDPTYKAIVGYWKEVDGKKQFVPYTVLNADNAFEFKKAKEWWAKEQQEKGLSTYEVIPMERKGLRKDTSFMKQYDGLADIFNKLAENNPDFAAAKASVDEAIKGQTQKLGRYDYHALKRMGVEGGVGRKPWLDATQNAKDFWKSQINTYDEGFAYWSYQDTLNKIATAVADPDINKLYPNTVDYLKKYKDNLTGAGLNQFGALGNAVVDFAFSNLGVGSAKAPRKALSEIRKATSILMMGTVNLGFIGIQMFQYWQVGMAEAARISKDFDLNTAASMAKSFQFIGVTRPWMEIAYAKGNLDKAPFDPVLKDAFVWAKEHGLTEFNEIALSHEAVVNPLKQKVEDLLSIPMTAPEMASRPAMFLWFVDLMKGKLSGEELYIAAKRATDHPMTNYKSDEAPLIYQRSGVLGENVGGLKRYVHNAGEQLVARTLEMKEYPEAFAVTAGITLLLQGITGMIGYSVADQMSQWMTDKPLRHWLEQLVSSPVLLDGFLSAKSGLDINAKFSLASVVPSDGRSFEQTMAGAHLSKLWKLGEVAVAYAKNPDDMSFNEFMKQAIPSGMYGLYEDANMMDEQGFVLNAKGQRKYTEPRSEGEQLYRKYMGIRPLRERLEDEDLYAADKAQRKMTDKQKDAYDRMVGAVNLQDEDGFNEAYLDYTEAEGNPTAIKPLMKKAAAERNLSARQRKILAPGKTIPSIKKYERYWE